jgi:hypothetical protein
VGRAVKKFHVAVFADNRSLNLKGNKNNPLASEEFRQWMKAQGTGRVTNSGWKLVKHPCGEQRFQVSWVFTNRVHAILFKLAFGGVS